MDYDSNWPEAHPPYSSAPAPLPQQYPAPPSAAIPAYDTAVAGIPRSPPPPSNPYAPHGGYWYPPLGPMQLSHSYDASAEVGTGNPHGLSGKEAIRLYGIDPGYSVHFAPTPQRPCDGLVPYGTPSFLTPHSKAHSYSGGAKRGSKKMTKVVQSGYCEVCKADCTSQDDLNNHKQGKRHKKNLQKLQDSITPKPQKLQVTPNAVEVEGKESDVVSEGKAIIGEQRKRKEASQATEEDLETKKRKMLESGATPDCVRVCTICNIVVNSQKVYDSHIVGQKHIAMVKEQQEVAEAVQLP